MRTKVAFIVLGGVVSIVFVALFSGPTRAATTSLPALGSFDLPTNAAKINDFYGYRDRLYCLTSDRNSDGSLKSELLTFDERGVLINRWDLPAHPAKAVRVSPSGRIAVLQHIDTKGTGLVLLYGTDGTSVATITSQEQTLDIAFVGDILLGINYGHALLISNTGAGAVPTSGGVGPWSVDNLGPFLTGATLDGKLCLIDAVAARMQVVNLQQNWVSPPFPLDIPQLDRASYGPDEGIISGVAVTPDGTVYCGITHSLLPDGAKVAVFNSAGAVKGLLKCQLPTYPQLVKRVNLGGYMFPGFLAATEHYLFWLDSKAKKISYYSRTI